LQTFGNIHIPLCMEGVHLRSRQGLTAHMWDYGAHVASGFFPMRYVTLLLLLRAEG